MKFVSKVNNYRVILSVGIPGNPVSGTPGKPGLSVKFEGGQAIVNDPEIIDKMLEHPSFNQDFIRVDEEKEVDPFKEKRQASEPKHVLHDIEHGNVKNVEKEKAELSPAMKKALLDAAKPMAVEMAKEMAPKLAVDILKQLKEDSASEAEGKDATSKPKKTQKTAKKK